ncbi:hypothetical protein BD779DRAFT_1677257 [Infundibulicybe gibba]|nr:hypothetical protein BD779DRAFT_1677257 [Infundibulicybe gibba]
MSAYRSHLIRPRTHIHHHTFEERGLSGVPLGKNIQAKFGSTSSHRTEERWRNSIAAMLRATVDIRIGKQQQHDTDNRNATEWMHH